MPAHGCTPAKAAAPYCHTRLSSTELSGPSGGPVSVQTSQKLDISERAFRKTIALQEEC
jgi:hypothetical protein